MARYEINHKTTYRYRYPVAVSHHSARLRPLSDASQSCESFALAIAPSSVDLVERLDFFGNAMHMFSVQEPHAALVVEARSQVYTTRAPIDLATLETPCAAVRMALSDYGRADLVDAKQFLLATDLTPDAPEVEAFGERFTGAATPFGQAIQDLLDAFADEFAFDASATEISTPVSKVLEQRRGVCQDFAHLSIAALRASGLAARYVSGYILTRPPEGVERLAGADASHAWVSVFHPEAGWIDIDPTNRLVCGDQHIRVAYGRDFGDVSMLKGAVTGGGDHKIKVEVTVQPVEA